MAACEAAAGRGPAPLKLKERERNSHFRQYDSLKGWPGAAHGNPGSSSRRVRVVLRFERPHRTEDTQQNGLGRLVGFEPTTSRTTIWRYYQLSYSRRVSSV